ncbi:nucleotidyltransferase substrate binding protein [Thermodesulfovibrio hydrogeniphilus]
MQRFNNYERALLQLKDAVDLSKKRELSELEKQGLIQAFEYTYELAWNLLKDYLEYQGISEIRGARDAIKKAFKYELIENADVWSEMISARNLTAHTYNTAVAEKVIGNILNKFYPEFEKLLRGFREIKENV